MSTSVFVRIQADAELSSDEMRDAVIATVLQRMHQTLAPTRGENADVQALERLAKSLMDDIFLHHENVNHIRVTDVPELWQFKSTRSGFVPGKIKRYGKQ